MLELSPELGDMNIHRPRHDLGLMSPDFLEKLEARDNCAATPYEGQQQIEFLRSECDFRLTTLD